MLATLNAVARVYLGAHNPLDVVGGAAVGLAIAAALDLVLDVARDRGGAGAGKPPRRGRTGPPELGRVQSPKASVVASRINAFSTRHSPAPGMADGLRARFGWSRGDG